MIDVLKALADENRLRIVSLLAKGSLCVCEIEKSLKISQNLVSHHLSVLKDAKIVVDCRCGKNKYYSLDKKAVKKFTNRISKFGE